MCVRIPCIRGDKESRAGFTDLSQRIGHEPRESRLEQSKMRCARAVRICTHAKSVVEGFCAQSYLPWPTNPNPTPKTPLYLRAPRTQWASRKYTFVRAHIVYCCLRLNLVHVYAVFSYCKQRFFPRRFAYICIPYLCDRVRARVKITDICIRAIQTHHQCVMYAGLLMAGWCANASVYYNTCYMCRLAPYNIGIAQNTIYYTSECVDGTCIVCTRGQWEPLRARPPLTGWRMRAAQRFLLPAYSPIDIGFTHAHTNTNASIQHIPSMRDCN